MKKIKQRLVVDWLGQGCKRRVFKVGKDEKLIYLLMGYKQESEKTVEVKLGEPGAQALILGALISQDGQAVIRTIQHHQAPNTESELLIKSVLLGKAKLDYQGLIRIEKEAQGSDAYQRNDSLLLSDQVQVETRPELEILADDVRCTHGATVGKIDEEMLFYLISRGITRKKAEKLVIAGFFDPVLKGRSFDWLIQQSGELNF